MQQFFKPRKLITPEIDFHTTTQEPKNIIIYHHYIRIQHSETKARENIQNVTHTLVIQSIKTIQRTIR